MVDAFCLRAGESALVLIDVQDRLAAVMEKRGQVVENCLHLIEAARLLSVPVVLTEQYPKGLGPTVPEIREAVAEGAIDPIEKIAFDCCGEAAFNERIAALGRRKLVLAGMETHVCVLQTCLGLLGKGYVVHVACDAVASRKKGDWKAGINFMRQAGAVITCTETVLFQLLERAGTEEFKAISRRIK